VEKRLDEAASATVSTSVFQALQCGHWPCHFGDWPPHSVQV
jgi:Zn-finger protein